MRYSIIRGCLVALFSLLAFVATAQTANEEVGKERRTKQEKEDVKVTTEFGLSAGALYNFMEVVPVGENFTQKISGLFGDKMPGNIGAVAALQFRINIGKSFGIQPEILYSYSTLKFTGPEYKDDIKVKCNLVQMPLLLSFRAAMFRFNFGPVFTLNDNPTYQLAEKSGNSIQTLPLGKLNPTITYAAGISVKLSKRSIIDIRWASQFKDIASENEFLWSLDTNEQAEPIKFYTRNSSVQVRFGLVF